jgi:hypothetical protein
MSWFREEAQGELEVLLGELAAAFGRCPLLCYHIMMPDNAPRLGMMPRVTAWEPLNRRNQQRQDEDAYT